MQLTIELGFLLAQEVGAVGEDDQLREFEDAWKNKSKTDLVWVINTFSGSL